jgi:hypothetical protein
VLQRPGPVVAPDWQVQTTERRHNAFDVPPDWVVGSEDLMVGFEDLREGAEPGDILVAMSAVSLYGEGWCEHDADGSLAMAGTKGAEGVDDTAEAARNEAVNWVLAAFDQEQRGTLEVSEAEPFTSEHGITGHLVRAEVTGVPDDPDDPCGTDGRAVAVTYRDLEGELATWVLVAAIGAPGAIGEETVDRIAGSLRPYPQP